MRRRSLRSNSSGQLLIVAALAIALLISSTTAYVYEVTRETGDTTPLTPIDTFVSVIKLVAKNAVISSLANVSNGGAANTLTSNLDKLSEAVHELSGFGICNLAYTVLNGSGYDSGIKTEWRTSGSGVSTAYVNFTLLLQGEESQITMRFAVNVTTSIAISGSCVPLGGGAVNVSLTCRMSNDGHPSSVEDLDVFYYDDGAWIQAGASKSLVVTDYGNGTYCPSFVATLVAPVQVSIRVCDFRGVFVQANATCPMQ